VLSSAAAASEIPRIKGKKKKKKKKKCNRKGYLAAAQWTSVCRSSSVRAVYWRSPLPVDRPTKSKEQGRAHGSSTTGPQLAGPGEGGGGGGQIPDAMNDNKAQFQEGGCAAAVREGGSKRDPPPPRPPDRHTGTGVVSLFEKVFLRTLIGAHE
jgi:hypothetical protein